MTDRDEHLEAQLRARLLPGLSDEARRRLLADLAAATMAAPSGAVVDRVGSAETVAHLTEGIREADVPPMITLERTRKMKRFAKFAMAATVLVALGILTSWMTNGGGSTNIALAQVADALDSLQSATYDVTSEVTVESDNSQPPVTSTVTGQGFFLAPSHERMEMTVNSAERTTEEHVAVPKVTAKYVTISDGQTKKSMTFDSLSKRARVKERKESAEDAPTDLFEDVRRIVREGSSGTSEKVEKLGKKEIDGRVAVGFQTRQGVSDVIVWADPETARPIRIETFITTGKKVHLVMDNFRYDVDLDPSLFSLKVPAGYTTPEEDLLRTEEDLFRTLRTVAEHSQGVFPAKLEWDGEVRDRVREAVMAVLEPELKPEKDKFEAEMEKIAAKYGGKDQLRAKYGEDGKLPPPMMAEITKAGMPFAEKRAQKQMALMQEYRRGITSYTKLKPENDLHYIGGGVKLGTPDCPILWHKPTGADKYRVIYADLSVRDMAPDDVKKLSGAKAK